MLNMHAKFNCKKCIVFENDISFYYSTFFFLNHKCLINKKNVQNIFREY